MRITILLSILIALALSGCVPVYDTYYTYQPPPRIQQRQCIARCQSAKTVCNSACFTRYNECQENAREEAEFQYEEYIAQQRRSGQPVTRDLSSFYNTFACKDSCGCTINYNNCYTLCGGRVYIHKRCIEFCGIA